MQRLTQAKYLSKPDGNPIGLAQPALQRVVHQKIWAAVQNIVNRHASLIYWDMDDGETVIAIIKATDGLFMFCQYHEFSESSPCSPKYPCGDMMRVVGGATRHGLPQIKSAIMNGGAIGRARRYGTSQDGGVIGVSGSTLTRTQLADQIHAALTGAGISSIREPYDMVLVNP